MPNPLRLRTSLRLSRTVHRTSDWEQLSGCYPRRLLGLIEPTADGEKKREGVIGSSTNRPFGENYGYHGGEEFKIERIPKGPLTLRASPPPQTRSATDLS